MPSLRLRAFGRLSVIFLPLFFFISAPTARGQITNITDQVATPAPGSGHDYIHLLNETVNPANGSLSVRIKVPLPPARKISIPFSFAYDSGNAAFLQAASPSGVGWATNKGPFAYGGWSYALPTLTRNAVQYNYTGQQLPDGSTVCQSTSSYMFTDAAGGVHELGLAHIYSYMGGQINDACTPALYKEFDTGNDDFAYPAALVGSSIPSGSDPTLSEGTITTAGPDGTVYTFNDGSWICRNANQTWNNGFPTSIVDRNGNGVVITGSPFQACTTLSITDSIGRPAVSAPFAITGTSNVTVAGLAQPYKVAWGTASASYTYSSRQLQTDPHCGMPAGANPGASNVVTSITLPNANYDQFYQFFYESTYGQISEIKFPSGGYVSYTWGLNPLASQVQFNDTNGGLGSCIYSYDVPVVTKRVVSFDGTTQALEQDFTYTTTWGTGSQVADWTQKTTTIVTKDLMRGTSFVTTYVYLPESNTWAPNTTPGLTGSQTPVEQTVTYYDTGGSLLKTVAEGWAAKNLLACSLTMIGGNSNLISGVFNTYGPGGQIANKYEYDYGSITSLTACQNGAFPPSGVTIARQTVTTPQQFPIASWYTGPIILDRPSKIQVYAGGAYGTLVYCSPLI